MDFNQYDYDRDLAENGRRIDLDATSYLIIARWGNKAFNALFTELTKPYGKYQDFGKFKASGIDQDEQLEIMYQLLAQTILVGWGGMQDGGEDLPYTVDNAIMILKKYDNFLGDVMRMSQDDATFRSESMAEELGNSETPSEASSESAGEQETPSE